MTTDNHKQRMSTGLGPGRLNHRIAFSPQAHGDLIRTQEAIPKQGPGFSKSVIARAAIDLMARTLERAEKEGNTDTLRHLYRLCWKHSSQNQKGKS